MGGLTSDRKFFLINTSDHSTTETYYFLADDKNINLKLFQKRKEKIRYNIDSWLDHFYIHTNQDNCPDYKICKCKHEPISDRPR